MSNEQAEKIKAMKPRAWALPIADMAGGGDYVRSVPADFNYPNGDPMPWEPLFDMATVLAALSSPQGASEPAGRPGIRDLAAHLRGECQDAADCGDGRLNTTRVLEIVDMYDTLGGSTPCRFCGKNVYVESPCQSESQAERCDAAAPPHGAEPAPLLREGWQPVPLIATAEMVEAARTALHNVDLSKMTPIARAHKKAHARWVAMLAAAPRSDVSETFTDVESLIAALRAPSPETIPGSLANAMREWSGAEPSQSVLAREIQDWIDASGVKTPADAGTQE